MDDKMRAVSSLCDEIGKEGNGKKGNLDGDGDNDRSKVARKRPCLLVHRMRLPWFCCPFVYRLTFTRPSKVCLVIHHLIYKRDSLAGKQSRDPYRARIRSSPTSARANPSDLWVKRTPTGRAMRATTRGLCIWRAWATNCGKLPRKSGNRRLKYASQVGSSLFHRAARARNPII